ncbi:hypothetical protein ACFOWE_31315 [Planomonospora corallina]|uniref:Uncharacterized protein n=1 Tax=Planomonospora corallina TaxID=1806052 RepID=A0ABV8IK06_9ACTN
MTLRSPAAPGPAAERDDGQAWPEVGRLRAAAELLRVSVGGGSLRLAGTDDIAWCSGGDHPPGTVCGACRVVVLGSPTLAVAVVATFAARGPVAALLEDAATRFESGVYQWSDCGDGCPPGCTGEHPKPLVCGYCDREYGPRGDYACACYILALSIARSVAGGPR